MALSSSVPSIATSVTGNKPAGFLSLQQRYAILKKLGYEGPPVEKSMAEYQNSLTGSKELVAKLGKKAQEMRSLNAGGVVSQGFHSGSYVGHLHSGSFYKDGRSMSADEFYGAPADGSAAELEAIMKVMATVKSNLNEDGTFTKAALANFPSITDGSSLSPEYKKLIGTDSKPAIQDTFDVKTSMAGKMFEEGGSFSTATDAQKADYGGMLKQKIADGTANENETASYEYYYGPNKKFVDPNATATNTAASTGLEAPAQQVEQKQEEGTLYVDPGIKPPNVTDSSAGSTLDLSAGANNDSAGGGASNNIKTGNGNTMAEEVTISDNPEDIYGGTIAAPVSTNLTEQTDQVVTNTPVTGDTIAEADIAKVGTSGKVDAATKVDASTYTAGTTAGKVKESLEGLEGLEGKVSEDAKVKAVTGELSDEAKAEGVKFEKDKIVEVTGDTRKVGDEELAVAAGQDEKAVTTQIAQADTPEKIEAAQAEVKREEIAKAAQIKESDMASATAIASDGLSDDATAVAAKLAKFTVDEGTLAEFIEGSVNAQDTVQGQLSSLMKDFDDGTPVWAAGAIRAANAAMAARGLGTSSMAGAAIMQAAMESAIPIAAQDAQTFANMNLANLNNQQKVALTNAAAQQGVEIANFNAEQQTALQNSQNSFSLQSQDLSNFQAVIIANAQIKASLQGQNLSNRQQANLAEAARYAEVSNINLNNRQQSILQDSANSLQVDLANLSAKQQAYVSNAQLEAALQGKKIDNRQQTAINNSARFAEANNLTFNAAQKAQIHNSELMKTVGLAELNSEQAATLQNAAQIATMDLANLNNRQQAAVQNAKAFLEMDLANLSNDQQVLIFKAQAIQQSLLQDVAQENAAKQFNAASETQTNQFFADLKANIDKYNLGQMNDFKKFDADQLNTTRQFNTSQNNSFKQFNQSNALIVAQANAAWRQSMATTNNATANEKAMFVAKEKNALTIAALDEIWQRKRDEIDYIFSAYESDQDRTQQIVLANMLENSEINAATFKAELEADATLISWGLDWLETKLTST